MAVLKDVSTASLVEELIRRSKIVSIVGTILTNKGEEQDIMIVVGDDVQNYYNLGFLQNKLINPTFPGSSYSEEELSDEELEEIQRETEEEFDEELEESEEEEV